MLRGIATTIGLSSVRGDLADRTLFVECPPLQHGFRTEEATAAAIDASAAATFASMLDLASELLAVLPRIEEVQRPRMSAFARLLRAVDLARGWSTEVRYEDACIRMNDTALGSDRLWPFLEAEVTQRGGRLEASASDIRGALLERLRLREEDRATLREAEGRYGALRGATATGSWLSRIAGPAGSQDGPSPSDIPAIACGSSRPPERPETGNTRPTCPARPHRNLRRLQVRSPWSCWTLWTPNSATLEDHRFEATIAVECSHHLSQIVNRIDHMMGRNMIVPRAKIQGTL